MAKLNVKTIQEIELQDDMPYELAEAANIIAQALDDANVGPADGLATLGPLSGVFLGTIVRLAIEGDGDAILSLNDAERDSVIETGARAALALIEGYVNALMPKGDPVALDKWIRLIAGKTTLFSMGDPDQ
jgi:hypothetical protein